MVPISISWGLPEAASTSWEPLSYARLASRDQTGHRPAAGGEIEIAGGLRAFLDSAVIGAAAARFGESHRIRPGSQLAQGALRCLRSSSRRRLRASSRLPNDRSRESSPAVSRSWNGSHGDANTIKRLSGKLAGHLRYRIGDWRVIYRIDDQENRILVHSIAHCREVDE